MKPLNKFILIALCFSLNFLCIGKVKADDLEVYDSGWINIDQNETQTLIHNLGGDINNYEIDLQQKDSSGWLIHNRGYGGMVKESGDLTGVFFRELNTSEIKVMRRADDTKSPEIRLVIRKNRDSNIQDNTSNISTSEAITNTNTNNITTNTTNINANTLKNTEQDRRLNDHNNKINGLNNRLGELEETQYVVETDFRILDTKKITISPFVRYNFGRSKVDTVGVRCSIKLGSSYEEREIAKTNKRLEAIERKLEMTFSDTAELPDDVEIIKTENGFRIQKKF